MLVKFFKRRTLRRLQREYDRVRASARALGGVHGTSIANLEAVWALQRRAAALTLQMQQLRLELDTTEPRV